MVLMMRGQEHLNKRNGYSINSNRYGLSAISRYRTLSTIFSSVEIEQSRSRSERVVRVGGLERGRLAKEFGSIFLNKD